MPLVGGKRGNAYDDITFLALCDIFPAGPSITAEAPCRRAFARRNSMSPSLDNTSLPPHTPSDSPTSLHREVGVLGAVMMGLGSIVGTGIFVSIGIAAGAAGPSVLLAITVAAVIATCNGLSSAQLAANHPVSGGTYEYGYRWLHPALGFTAGWMFLCAKSASAATAALGFAGYVLNVLGQSESNLQIPLAIGAVAVLTILVLSGIKRSNAANIGIVSVTLFSLLGFVGAGLISIDGNSWDHLTPFFAPVSPQDSPVAGFLQACALMFVAYTGYGRIATLGEEIRDPYRNIPRAIVATLLISMTLYVAVGLVGIVIAGAAVLAEGTTQQAAPLEVVARRLSVPGIAILVAVGAITAMLGVLLNLILGLSRVALAMGRRGDLPPQLTKLSASSATPWLAVVLVSVVIAGLVLLGDVKTTWSFSAFTVLVYYALTNLAALRLSDEERLYPRVVPWGGLIACLFLAFWVDMQVWMTGLGLIAVGLLWRQAARRLFQAGS